MRTNLPLVFATLLAGLPTSADTSPPALFAAATTPLYDAPGPEAAAIGNLLVAARMIPLAQDATGWQKVRVRGWTQAGAERIVQTAPGIRVTRAALAKSGLAALAFGEVRDDPDTGLTWTFTELTGWIAPDAGTVAELDILWARAEELFATRCTSCHQRRVPEHYTANQWTSHLKVMGPRTGLPKGDQALIRVFLQYRSADADALAAALAEE